MMDLTNDLGSDYFSGESRRTNHTLKTEESLDPRNANINVFEFPRVSNLVMVKEVNFHKRNVNFVNQASTLQPEKLLKLRKVHCLEK